MLNEMNVILFSQRIKEIRKQRKLTQQELAEKTGIPTTSISHIEAGSRRPSLENFYKLVIVLNISAEYLLGITHEVSDQHVDPISKILQKLPEIERDLITKFIMSLELE